MAAILAGDEPPGASEEDPPPPAQLAKSPWLVCSRSCVWVCITSPRPRPCGWSPASLSGAIFTAGSLCLRPGLLSFPPSCGPSRSAAHTPALSQSLAWLSGCRSVSGVAPPPFLLSPAPWPPALRKWFLPPGVFHPSPEIAVHPLRSHFGAISSMQPPLPHLNGMEMALSPPPG